MGGSGREELEMAAPFPAVLTNMNAMRKKKPDRKIVQTLKPVCSHTLLRTLMALAFNKIE